MDIEHLTKAELLAEIRRLAGEAKQSIDMGIGLACGGTLAPIDPDSPAWAANISKGFFGAQQLLGLLHRAEQIGLMDEFSQLLDVTYGRI